MKKSHPRRTPVASLLLMVAAGLLMTLTAGCNKERSDAEVLLPETAQLLKAAEVHLKRWDMESALTLVDSASARQPDAVEPRFMKGLIYSNLLRWDDAERAYREVLKKQPNYRGVWFNLGNNEARRKRYPQAITLFRKELVANPAPAPWNAIGTTYGLVGKIDSASTAFEEALRLDSTYVPALLAYARLYEREGEYARALPLAERAFRKAPNESEVHFTLGTVLLSLNRIQEAIPHLEAVALAQPWHSQAHYRLGQALQRTGKARESEIILKHAARLNKLQSDVSIYENTVANEPQNPYAHAALATALRLSGRYDEALGAYRIALLLDPTDAEFLNNIASIQLLKGDHEGAVQTYQDILRRDDTMVTAWLNLGVVYARTGQPDQARAAWQRALQVEPDNSDARRFLDRMSQTVPARNGGTANPGR